MTLLLARRRGATAALLAGSVVLTLVASESLLALLGFEARYQRRVEVPSTVPWWQCENGLGCRYRRNLVDQPERYNEEGFRDRDDFRSPPPKDGRCRILLLGDSFAYGASAYGPGESFADIVEQRLPALLWNTGIPGNGQSDEIVVLQQLRPRLAPDLVILAFYMNDFDDNLYPPGKHYVFSDGNWILRYERQADGGVRELSPAAAYRRVFHEAEGARQELETTRLGTLGLRAARRLRGLVARGDPPTPKPSGAEAPGLAATRDLLAQIRDIVRGDAEAAQPQSEFLVLIIPSRADLATPPTQRYFDALGLCAKLGLDCLEVRESLTLADYDRPHPLDSHWTAAGHAKVSDALIKRIGVLRARQAAGEEQ